MEFVAKVPAGLRAVKRYALKVLLRLTRLGVHFEIAFCIPL